MLIFLYSIANETLYYLPLITLSIFGQKRLIGLEIERESDFGG